MIKSAIRISFLLLTTLLVSCVSSQKLRYFTDIDELTDPIVNPRTQKLIMPFDKVYIRVVSIDPQANEMFNTSSDQMSGASGSGGILGYLVDENGYINFPFVGNINVLSMTMAQAAEKIHKALSDYIPNTSVTVKFIDNQVTLIGEVQRQGVYPFIQDKLNIYEAIGLSGGLTRYGDRKNVILIRNESGKIMHYRLNLSDSKIASKDTYYILPNDVIVVEPMKAISNTYSNTTYSAILSAVSTLITILVFFNVR